MKIIAALLVLALFSSARAYLLFPRHSQLIDLRDAFHGALEGLGASKFNIQPNEDCLGEPTKENLAALLDELMNLQMSSSISDLVPVFQALSSLATGFYNNCEVSSILSHVLAHSGVSSIQSLAMNLIHESHHLQHLAMEFFVMTESGVDFAKAGRIFGEAFGVILSLQGVENVPHN